MSVEVDDKAVMTGNEASNLVEVDVEINGMTTTLQLDRAEAERRGLVQSKAHEPANKARTPRNKGGNGSQR
ncbi:hypothetical protein [Mycobacteroides abscessus]|uniref:hypothetical protein n=1 Tax=Mycobacteroides abscessus TaxID=36809 RepID=UPI001877FF80|nr:hypothetical protein [Mycobacteroides abscessus]